MFARMPSKRAPGEDTRHRLHGESLRGVRRVAATARGGDAYQRAVHVLDQRLQPLCDPLGVD